MIGARRRPAILVAAAIAACAGKPLEVAPPIAPADHDAATPPPVADAGVEVTFAIDAAPPPAPHVYHWLKGTTHVHSVHSGDSLAPVEEVVRWYTDRGYDFIYLTDHNKVTPVDDGDGRLLVMPGIELTFNPDVCKPDPPLPTGKCRIHVNGLDVGSIPEGKLEWADRQTDQRVEQYQRGLDAVRVLGGLAVLNHPSWQWGMDGAQLIALAARGYRLFEIGNQQFAQWDRGDELHPALDTIWDQALIAGVTLWGIASDDAHTYDQPGKYPAGGGWVMVDAERDPLAIRAALEEGAFYGSTGVVLARAGVEDGALVVEVDAAAAGTYTIRFIGAGRLLREEVTRSARFPLDEAPGYVRAVVLGPDDTMAWVQPARP